MGKSTAAGRVEINDTAVKAYVGTDEVLDLSSSSYRLGVEWRYISKHEFKS
jgi:hypothetical protein